MPVDSLNVIGPDSAVFDSSAAGVDFSLTSVIEDQDYMVNDTMPEQSPIIVQHWQEGLEGASLQKSHSGNSGILTVIVILFVAISMNFADCKKLFARFVGELFNNKKRENAFDEHSNHEARLTLLTIIQYLVYGGIILAAIAQRTIGDSQVDDYNFGLLVKCTGLFTAYYLLQCIAYSITGYTFGGKEACRRWIRSLNASQSLAGLGLVLPGLFLLFYPTASNIMIYIACIVYILARIMFVYKGFCIFYKNIFSLVYFILYLCALEIIPLICILKLDTLIA